MLKHGKYIKYAVVNPKKVRNHGDYGRKVINSLWITRV